MEKTLNKPTTPPKRRIKLWNGMKLPNTCIICRKGLDDLPLQGHNLTMAINLGQGSWTICKFAGFWRTKRIFWKMKDFSFSTVSSSHFLLLIFWEKENWELKEKGRTYILWAARVAPEFRSALGTLLRVSVLPSLQQETLFTADPSPDFWKWHQLTRPRKPHLHPRGAPMGTELPVLDLPTSHSMNQPAVPPATADVQGPR